MLAAESRMCRMSCHDGYVISRYDGRNDHALDVTWERKLATDSCYRNSSPTTYCTVFSKSTYKLNCFMQRCTTYMMFVIAERQDSVTACFN